MRLATNNEQPIILGFSEVRARRANEIGRRFNRALLLVIVWILAFIIVLVLFTQKAYSEG